LQLAPDLNGADHSAVETVMVDRRCEAREVKECLLLADALKSGPFESHGFRNRVVQEWQRISKLSVAHIDQTITDSSRRTRYSNGTWMLTVVDLASCSVWPRMGQRQWATGPVPCVAQKVWERGGASDKIIEMVRAVRLSFAEVPLIVFRRKQSPQQFRIDDGCHRAVAYYLAGFRQAFAFVGDYNGPHELNWPWEGE
jgi:hypothetical protein